MPKTTGVAIPPEEPAQMRAARRRARDGSLLALHLWLWCAAGRKPTAMAAVLLCSRSRVYRTVRADQAGPLGLEPAEDGRLSPPRRTTVLVPPGRRSLVALLKAPPRASGWCRTRWSGATLALTLPTTRGRTVSAETMRRWVHEVGGVWKRAQLVAQDDDPQRVDRLARIRLVFEPRKRDEALGGADELDMYRWPTGGDAWRPTGTPVEVMTPGQNETHDWAGALDPTPGTRPQALGPRNTHALFRELLTVLEARYPADRQTRLDVVVDHSQIHPAQPGEPGLAAHPRVRRLFVPTSCPRANPIERAFGDVHDCGTRHHQRKRLPALVVDVEDHLHLNGPWKDKRSDRYFEPAVTTAVANSAAEEHANVAA